jgi:hypothetical protein
MNIITKLNVKLNFKALFGVIGSFKGTQSFRDAMENNSKLKTWYELSREYIENSRGGFYLNNPQAFVKNQKKQQQQQQQQQLKNAEQNNSEPRKKRFGIF